MTSPASTMPTGPSRVPCGTLLAIRVALLSVAALAITPSAALSQPDPGTFFISQFPADAPAHVRRHNQDCGPACLAMALKRWHRVPSSPFTRASSPARLITAARLAMTGQADHQLGTRPRQVASGAAAFGLNALVVPDLAADDLALLDANLARGRMVVANGNPLARGAYATRLSRRTYYRNDTNHFVLIAARAPDGRYLVNDPLSRLGSLTVSRRGLKGFLASPGLGTGVVLWP